MLNVQIGLVLGPICLLTAGANIIIAVVAFNVARRGDGGRVSASLVHHRSGLPHLHSVVLYGR